MMFKPHTILTTNWNGRLFADCFSITEPYDKDLFSNGNVHQITTVGKDWGTAEVMAVRTFLYKDIRDPLSYLIAGQPAHFLAAKLKQLHGDGLSKTIDPQFEFAHIIYLWKERNWELQQYELAEWWRLKTEQHV